MSDKPERKEMTIDDMDREVSPDFRGYHVDATLSGVTPSGIRLVFCELDPTSKKGARLLEKCSIVLHPDTARSTAQLILRQIGVWQQIYGGGGDASSIALSDDPTTASSEEVK